MNTKRVFLMVMLGSFLAASAGLSQAGDQMNSSASPKFGTWEYWMAEETGNLPSPESSTNLGKESMNTVSARSGTWEYWMAEETGNLPGSEPSGSSSRVDDSRGKTVPGSGQDAGEPDWRTIKLEP